MTKERIFKNWKTTIIFGIPLTGFTLYTIICTIIKETTIYCQSCNYSWWTIVLLALTSWTFINAKDSLIEGIIGKLGDRMLDIFIKKIPGLSFLGKSLENLEKS